MIRTTACFEDCSGMLRECSGSSQVDTPGAPGVSWGSTMRIPERPSTLPDHSGIDHGRPL